MRARAPVLPGSLLGRSFRGLELVQLACQEGRRNGLALKADFSANGGVGVLLGNGDGTFQAAYGYATGA